MEIIILVTLDILFLILLACCVSLDKRLGRLETDTARRISGLAVKTADCRREVEALRSRLKTAAAGDTGGDEEKEEARLKEKLAEKRFTEGIASILAYDSDTGRRAPNEQGK